MRAAILSITLLLLGACPETIPQAQTETWHSLEEARVLAQRAQQPIFVYVHAPWCGPCHRLERDVLPKLDLDRFIKAAVDLSERPDPGYSDGTFEWLRRSGLDVPPTFALVGPNGDLKAAITGFRDAPELALFLTLAETGDG